MKTLEEIELELADRCELCCGNQSFRHDNNYWCTFCGGSGLARTVLSSEHVYNTCSIDMPAPFLSVKLYDSEPNQR